MKLLALNVRLDRIGQRVVRGGSSMIGAAISV
jgi:hypothetical protein